MVRATLRYQHAVVGFAEMIKALASKIAIPPSLSPFFLSSLFGNTMDSVFVVHILLFIRWLEQGSRRKLKRNPDRRQELFLISVMVPMSQSYSQHQATSKGRIRLKQTAAPKVVLSKRSTEERAARTVRKICTPAPPKFWVATLTAYDQIIF